MTGSWAWDLLIGAAVALAVTWLALIATLAILRPRGNLLREALRLLPDVLRLIRRAGLPAVRRHWPGTDDGFTALTRLTGLDGHEENPP